MARLKSIKIDTDKQIARALTRPGTETRSQLQSKMNLVKAEYNKQYKKSAPERAKSPFEQKDQVSVLDSGVYESKFINGELVMIINAPAAEFVEIGNKPSTNRKTVGIDVKKDHVQTIIIKSKRSKKKRKKHVIIGSETEVRRGKKGGFVLFRKRRGIDSAEGRHLLENAVRHVFGS